MATSGRSSADKTATQDKTVTKQHVDKVQTNTPAETPPVEVPESADPDNTVIGYTTHEPVAGSDGPRSQLELDQQAGR